MYVKLCGPIVAVHNYERVCGLASAKAVRYVHMSARVHMSMFGLTCLVSLYTMIKLATFLNEQKKNIFWFCILMFCLSPGNMRNLLVVSLVPVKRVESCEQTQAQQNQIAWPTPAQSRGCS